MQDPLLGLSGRMFTGDGRGGGSEEWRVKGYRGQHPSAVAVNCPRCDSSNTKFCYYNNYNLSQPRHFCRSCRRYWTRGGVLRNVPVGGGCRKSSSGKKSLKPPSSPSESSRSRQAASGSRSEGPSTTSNIATVSVAETARISESSTFTSFVIPDPPISAFGFPGLAGIGGGTASAAADMSFDQTPPAAFEEQQSVFGGGSFMDCMPPETEAPSIFYPTSSADDNDAIFWISGDTSLFLP